MPVHSRRHRRLARLRPLPVAVALLASLAALAATTPASAAPTTLDSHPRWVGAWSASPQPPNAVLDGISVRGLADQTLRLVVRPHAGGGWLRLRLANTFGDRPVTYGRVEVGRRQSGAAFVPGSNHPVTFSGQRSVTIPAGAKARSDPLPLQVEAEQDHAVSLFVPGPTGRPSLDRLPGPAAAGPAARPASEWARWPDSTATCSRRPGSGQWRI